MASYTWPDGSRGHTIPWAQHDAAMKEQAAAKAQEQQNRIRQAAANRTSAPSPVGILGSNPAPGAGAPAKGIVGAGLGPPPEPPAPPKRAPFQFTPDAEMNNALATNKQRYDDRMADYEKQANTARFDFGIDDPTNPNSRQAALREHWLAQGKSSSVSLNSRGQLFSGAMLRAITRNQRGQDRDQTALRRAYQEALDAIARSRTGAKTDREDADERARHESFDRQLNAYNAS